MKKTPLKKTSKSELAVLKKELDKIASQQARGRDGFKCQKCGVVSNRVHAAHIFSRGNLATRWNLDNLVTLDYYCHLLWSHRQPLEFAEWVQNKLGKKKYEALKKKSQTIYQFTKQDYDKWLQYLMNKGQLPN